MKAADQTDRPADTKPRRFWSLSGIFALLFFLALFRLDFPKPTLDDLFFVGASLNLAQGGDFSNPLLERQQFPCHFYFVQPPAYSFALAGWLNIFGVHRVSLLGFQLLMYLLICGATIFLLQKYRGPPGLEWLVPLGVAAAFLPEGLRPEAFSVALTLCGFALLESGSRRAVWLFTGFLLMMGGASVDSRLVFFSAALLLAALVNLRRNHVATGRLLTLAGLALLAVSLIVMQMINFQLADFWRTYHFHAAGRIDGNKFSANRHFFSSFSLIQWPLIMLWLGLLPMLPRWHQNASVRVGIYLMGAFILAAIMGVLGHGSYWYIFMVVLLTVTPGLERLAKPRAFILSILLVTALLAADSRILVYAGAIISNRIKADMGPDQNAAATLSPTPEHPLLVDSETARYVFDYRLPAGCLDWNFSSMFPGTLPTDAPLRSGDIYLIGPASVDWLNIKTHLNLPPPKWTPPGSAKSFHEFPRRVYLIRAADCAGLKTAN